MSFDYGEKRNQNIWFYEGPAAKITSNDVIDSSGSINTTAIDKYRQGVEMTQLNHWAAGIVKIHAGEPDHVLKMNSYGINENNVSNEVFFKDLDYFDPVKYLESQMNPTNVYILLMTYPIITNTANQSENFSFNGTIEPLTIRAVASFFSIDVPFEAHSIKGTLMAGNQDHWYGSDQVVSIFNHEPNNKHVPYLDSCAVNIPGTQQTVGYFFNEHSNITPFYDNFISKGVMISTTTMQDMLLSNSLLMMSSSNSDNYIDDRKACVCCGFMYDNAFGSVGGGGTDSIVFGGTGY